MGTGEAKADIYDIGGIKVMCAMDNKNWGQRVVDYLIKNYKIPVAIMVLCVCAALFFALSRPVVYQSELTFSVIYNRPLGSYEKKERLQSMARFITSDSILKPVAIEADDSNIKNLNSELLSTDYRGEAIRAQNQLNMDMIKIYAHGSTPEEAQNICNGTYEHLKAAYCKQNLIGGEKSYIIQDLERNMKDARQKYEEYCKMNSYNTADNQRKSDLYNNVIRWETTYQDFLRDSIRMNYYEGYQLKLISDASLPTAPIPSRTGFIVGVSIVTGLILCLIYGVILVKLKLKNKSL